MATKPLKTKTVAAEAVAETKASPKGKAPPAAPAKAAAPSKEVAIPTINSKALSLDVGPRVVKTMSSVTADEQQSKELARGAELKRREGLILSTAAIVHAAQNDKSIHLEDVVSKSEQVKDRLLEQLWIACGFKHVIQVGEEGKQKPKLVWTEEVAPYVHAKKKEDSEELFKKKMSVRANLSTLMKKAAQAALFIVENKIEHKIDKDSGQMMISGPAVTKEFGQSSVMLNENQTVQVKDKKGVATGETVKLKSAPSFQALATKAAEAHGRVVAPRVDSRKEVIADPEKEVEAMAKRFVAVLAGLAKLDVELKAETKAALDSVYNAIDELL